MHALRRCDFDGEIIKKLQSAVPFVLQWIERTLDDHRGRAIFTRELPFIRLKNAFPPELLERTKVVTLNGKVPFPPLSRFGLNEFAQLEKMPVAGITYKDTFFVNHLYRTESLCFHELVHVIQWEVLGPENFLMTYGVGIIKFGYRRSPLEQLAFSLQKDFDVGGIEPGIEEFIKHRTNEIWADMSPLISRS